MKSWKIVVLAACVILVTIIIKLPATFVWSQVENQVSRDQFAVNNVSGSIWDAQFSLQPAGLPPSQINVTPGVFTLLTGGLAANFSVEGQGHNLTGSTTLADDSILIESLEGAIASSYLNQSLALYGLNFSGTLNLNNITLKSTETEALNAAGNLTWDGGTVTYETTTRVDRYQLPPLQGELSIVNKRVQLLVEYQKQTLLTVQLQPNGWTKIQMYGRMITVAGVNWPGTFADDEVVVSFEEKLFSGIRL